MRRRDNMKTGARRRNEVSQARSKDSRRRWSDNRLVGGQGVSRDREVERLEVMDGAARDRLPVAHGEVILAEVVVGGAIPEQTLDDHEDRVGDRDGGFRAAAARSRAPRLGRRARCAWSGPRPGPPRSGARNDGLPWRVVPLRRFPARALFPGHRPAHDARGAALGKRVRSGPIAASTVSATRRPPPESYPVAPTPRPAPSGARRSQR